MARALWKGTINFGLVAMPIELLVADASQAIDLDMLDERDNARIKYKRVNSSTGREVPWKSIVKGFKTKTGDYVVLTDKDLKKANVKASQTIDIASFVDVEAIDVRYFEKPYYIKPLKGGEKPYALLYRTLMETKKIGIATLVIRTKQHLAALMPRDGVLILEIMRFPDELRDRKQVGVSAVTAKVSPRELKMAKDLVASMTDEWNPKEYRDTYREDVMKMIKYKIKHGETESIPEAETDEVESNGKVVDLMPLLRKSLESKGKSPSTRKRVKRGASKVSQQA